MNDDLIEKAAKAIAQEGRPAWRWEEGDEWEHDLARNEARAALAVFEEAHAPTGDERTPEFESLEQELFKHQPVLSMTDGSIAGCLCMDRVFYKRTEDWGTHLAEVFEGLGFRRPVSPEPITEEQINAERARQIEKGYTPEHDRQHGIAHVLRYALHYGSRGEHLKAYAMVEAALEIAPPMSPNEPQGAPTIRDHVRALTGVTDEGLDELGGFQREPTATQAPRCGGGRTNCRNDQWPPMHTMACPVSKARAAAETTERGERR